MQHLKSPKLNEADRTAIQAIASVMMDMNARDDRNSCQHHCTDESTLNWGTYGHLSNAIAALVFNATGRDIRNVDWNLGAYASLVDDIQAAVYDVVEREHVEELIRVCKSCPGGNLTLPAVRDALKAHGIRIRKEKSGDYIVSHKDDNPRQWFISSDLLECLSEGQRKARCVIFGDSYIAD